MHSINLKPQNDYPGWHNNEYLGVFREIVRIEKESGGTEKDTDEAFENFLQTGRDEVYRIFEEYYYPQ
jgi:hypothetical protein